MRRSDRFLIIGITASALIHAAVMETIFLVNESETARRLYERSTIVPFTVPPPPPPPPAPPPPPPPKPKPKEPPRPIPNTDKPVEPPVEEVKEVFGASKETATENAAAGIGVRIGNTLAKEMEKEYTPPEEVKPLPKAAEEPRPAPPPPRKFSPAPLFKIAKMPEVKTKITPTYPPALRKDEVEGEVLLKVAIDREGNIVSITVVSSDHELFTEAAIAAVKSWKFSPAFLPDGTPTDVVIEVPVIFQLEF